MHDRVKGQDNFAIQMRANLQLRELRKSERSLYEAMTEKRKQYSAAQPEAQRAKQEYDKARTIVEKTEIERARFTGSRDTVVINIKTLKQQLAEPQYKRIEHEHREKLIEHKTVQMAVDDLNKWVAPALLALTSRHPSPPPPPPIHFSIPTAPLSGTIRRSTPL